MGGIGSGNHVHAHRPRKRLTIEDVLTLSSAILRAGSGCNGVERWVCCDERVVEVTWRINRAAGYLTLTPSWDRITQNIDIEAVEQPRDRGGWRWSFRCPGCDRPCRTLHCPPMQPVFKCRTCSKLTYRACQESDQHRCLYRFLGSRQSSEPEDVRLFIDGIDKWHRDNQSLTRQERVFVLAYAETSNVYKAMHAAEYKGEIPYEVLRRPAVRKAITQAREDMMHTCPLSAAAILQELRIIATADITDFDFDQAGQLVSKYGDPAATRAVARAKRKVTRKGIATEIVLWDKVAVLKLQAKLMGLLDNPAPLPPGNSFRR